jgi:hypothetical protein
MACSRGNSAASNSLVDNAKAFSAGIAASPDEFASFSDEDKLVYFGTIFGFFKHFEHMYAQHRRGFIGGKIGTPVASIFFYIFTSQAYRRGGL